MRCLHKAVHTKGTAGVMFIKGSKKGTLLFEEAHGVGGLSE